MRLIRDGRFHDPTILGHNICLITRKKEPLMPQETTPDTRLCSICQSPISEERLDILPETTVCVNCTAPIHPPASTPPNLTSARPAPSTKTASHRRSDCARSDRSGHPYRGWSGRFVRTPPGGIRSKDHSGGDLRIKKKMKRVPGVLLLCAHWLPFCFIG